MEDLNRLNENNTCDEKNTIIIYSVRVLVISVSCFIEIFEISPPQSYLLLFPCKSRKNIQRYYTLPYPNGELANQKPCLLS